MTSIRMFCLILLLLAGCRPSQPTNLDTATCIDIAQIRSLPMKEPGTDPVYQAVMEQPRETAIRCLISDVVSAQPIPDPRESFSRPQGITRGDLAVFLLLEITEQDWLDIAPVEMRARFESNGVFAYFDFVEQPGNRRMVQRWWQDWLRSDRSQNR